MKKQWYVIEIECIKYKSGMTFLVGQKEEIAKIKSKGLAFIVANDLEKTYPPEFFNLIIK